MTGIVLTQHSGAFLGPIARVLGYIMNWIYMFLDGVFGIQNIGLCIILFTIIMYLILMPLTLQQQKFSKITQTMQPDLQAVQKKYKGKKDADSMRAMQEETRAVYAEYGVSQTGSCVQLLVQMPILFALFRVINNIPAYVSGIKGTFDPVVNGIMGTEGYQDTLQKFAEEINLNPNPLVFAGDNVATANSIIDVLHRLPSTAWASLSQSFPNLGDSIHTLQASMAHMNNFLGLNIADSPLNLIRISFENGQFLVLIAALMIPILSAGTQFLNIKLMPTPAPPTDGEGSGTMATTMKSMNYMMPLMSLFFVFTMPIGMGIYWTAGSVIRSIQQFLINRHYDRIGIETVVQRHKEKAKTKKKKKGFLENQISNAAQVNTKKISDRAGYSNTAEQGNISLNKAVDEPRVSPSPAGGGSLMSKANMVRDFNERKNK